MSFILEGPLVADTKLFVMDDGSPIVGYSAFIHTVDMDLKVRFTLSVDFIADFVKSYGDRVVYKGIIAFSDWIKKVIPYRDNLELTIVRQYPEGTSYTRYKAVIPNHQLAPLSVDQLDKLGSGQLDQHQMGLCELHAKHLSVEAIQLATIGGNYTDVTVDQLLNNTLKYACKDYAIMGRPIVDEVVIRPPNNVSKVNQVVIPSGTGLVYYPHLLQNRVGVYTTGLGSYIRTYEDGQVVWWIYSLYDATNWENSKERLIIMLGGAIANINNVTYQRDGVSTIIYASYPQVQSEGLDNRPPIRPTGIKVFDTTKALERPYRYDSTGVYAEQTQIYKEVDLYTNPDGVDHSQTNTSVTSNYYRVASDVALNSVIPITVEWNHSDHTLIIPGMIARIYLDKGTYVEQVDATVLGYHTTANKIGDGVGRQEFTERTLLSLVYILDTHKVKP